MMTFVKTIFVLLLTALMGGNIQATTLVSDEYAAEKDNTNVLVSCRPEYQKRLFHSSVIEGKIKEITSLLKNEYLAWMFENCFPNTLDTTVHYSQENGIDDTFVYTGDIHAMWLRDSGAQVWPYVQFANSDPQLKRMLRGVILRQIKCILLDPYANAFNKEPIGGEWMKDKTDMKPELHERKYEIDSLCYPIRLAYEYWKITGDASLFDENWVKAVQLILQTFKEQQRKEGKGPYRFQRLTFRQIDTMSNDGWGHPANPVGLIVSAFRPSDDATTYPFLIPSNFFAVTSLRKAAEIVDKVNQQKDLSKACNQLASEVEVAIRKYGVHKHPVYGDIYVFEVDGFGNQLLMDDANVPSLLGMAYLGDVDVNDPVYQNTRRFVWSKDNPYFFKGAAAEGIGGPHIGYDMIWPMSIMMKAFTSQDDKEIASCIKTLMATDAGTGFMHESFHKDDASKYTRAWFAWQNTLFGELILKLIDDGKLDLLNNISLPSVQKNTYKHPDTPQTDRNVILPPSWAFGMLYGGYTNQKETMERVDEIISHDYPIDAYWIDSWFWDYANRGKGPDKYMDFIADTVNYPDRKQMWNHLQERNVKGGFWAWDCIFKTGNEEVFQDFLKQDFFKNTYYESNPWHNNSTTTAMYQASTGEKKKGTHCGNIDFEMLQAVDHFKQLMKPFFDEGADFIKLDRTAEVPVCKVMFEMSQEFGRETNGRGFLLSHTSGCDTEEYKKYPGKWCDDTRSDWTVEAPLKSFGSWVPAVALKENIAMYTNSQKKSSEIPFLTNDMGGFDMGFTDKLDEELYIRWMQFSMFCPIVEAFCQPQNKTANLGYRYSVAAHSQFLKLSHLRMMLFPYIYSYAHLSRLEGKHIIKKLEGQFYEFGLGNELLVAPVYERGQSQRTLKFPEGNWVDYRTGKVYQGNTVQTVDAPISHIPLFVKKGSIIPMRNYSRSIDQGTNDSLTIHIYPGSNGCFTLIEDDGNSNEYLDGIYAKTEMSLTGNQLAIDPVLGTYAGMSGERKVRLAIHSMPKIKGISANGKKVSCSKKGGVVYSSWIETNKADKQIIDFN